MRVHQLQYQNDQHLIEWLEEKVIRDSTQLLIQIYTCSVETSFIASLVTLLDAALPLATLIGCTTEGEIFDGEVWENTTTLSFIEFEKTYLHSSLHTWSKNMDPKELGETIAEQLLRKDTQSFIIFTNELPKIENFVKGIESAAPHVVLAGGISANKLGQTVLFSKQGLITKGAVGISLSGTDLHVNNAYCLNWQSIGKYFTVTHAVGNRIYSIDHMSVLDLYKKYLGEQISKQIIEKSSQFPLILQRNEIDISRDVIAIYEDGSVSVTGDMFEGETVRFGFGDPESIVIGSKKMIESFKEIPTEMILVYSCEARRRFMFNSIACELSPLQIISPTAGFFTHGEFYHNKQSNMLLNHSMTLLVLSENPDAVHEGDLQEVLKEAPWEKLDALKAMTHLAQVSTDELVQLNASLETSEQQYKSLVQYNPDIVYSIGANGTVLSLNQTFYDLLGYSEGEVVTLFDVIHTMEKCLMLESIERALQGNPQTVEISFIKKDRSLVPFMITKIPIVVNNEMVGVYGIAKNISERKEAEARITFMAYHDVLTGLPNRTLFYKHLTELLNNRENQRPFAIMFLDLDNFKEINDTHGHILGDQILKMVAFELEQMTLERGITARFGGDEFAIVWEADNLSEVKTLAEQVVLHFERPQFIDGKEQSITTSIGISMFPNDGHDPETLLRNADLAMYRAKQSGKNRYQFFTNEISEQTREKRGLISDLRKAIVGQELQVYYQPIVDLKTNQMIGSEALVRWFHKERGSVQPSLFIPIAEENGLIDMLGYWVLKTACIQQKRWHDKYGITSFLSVNVSYQQFQRNDFVEIVKEVLFETGLKPAWLHLEITERTALVNLEHTRSILCSLQMMGVSISMDDFGTGFSSLSCVKDLSIDKLKIDRSFITNISTDERDAAIVKTIIALSRNLNMKVLAEGIETKEQLEKLAEYECDEIQGYLLSPPVSADQFGVFLMNGRSR